MTIRFRSRWLLASVAFLALGSSQADAQNRVQPPTRAKVSAKTKAAVKAARTQRVKPAAMKKISTSLTKAVGARGANINDKAVQTSLSNAPLKARLEVFQKLSKAQGEPVQSFTRRLRGMLKNGKTNRVVTSHKTFFEVLPSNLNLFRESMGGNVIWFAANASPGHLHTLVSDQGGGTNFTHNTYGSSMNGATITGKQYIAPAQLNKEQMSRFTKYLNAGVEANSKSEVYGFKNSRGEWIMQTACTNWATSAPIGDLKRWAKSLDKKVIQQVKSGALGAKFKDGLHSAMAKAPSAEARAALVREVVALPGLNKISKSSAKRLNKEFNVILEKFPKRPPELVARQSLSEIMGVSRSQDPAKWMYDLVLSKNVPVVGVTNRTKDPNFKDMTFNMEIMGTFNKQGDVIKHSGSKGLGVVPADRRQAN